jgi:DNA repair protein RadC
MQIVQDKIGADAKSSTLSKTAQSERGRSFKSRVKYTLPQLKLCLVGEPSRARKLIPIQAPEDAARFLNPLRYAAEEHFVSLHLNARHEVLGLHEVSHGSLSASLVHPREVFKAALLANSYAIIVCHNHPSGSKVVPSKEDLETTGQLFNAGKLLGVTLIDHLIVGPGLKKNTVYSVREHYPELWKSI